MRPCSNETDEKNHISVSFFVVASSHTLINLFYLLVVFLINDVMLVVHDHGPYLVASFRIRFPDLKLNYERKKNHIRIINR